MHHGISAIGICSWDQLLVTDVYPGPGEHAIVREQVEQAGGTTGNTCAALGRLGVPVLLASFVGDDDRGSRIVASLREAGCETRHVRHKPGEPTDGAYIIVSGSGQQTDRTIYWIQGAKPTMGDPLPVEELLEYRWVLVDVDDPRLRSFWLDLPAHQSPRTRLIGTLTFLVDMESEAGWEQALRHDIMIGNQRELCYLSQTSSLEQAMDKLQRELRFNACTAAFISRGPDGAVAIRPDGVVTVPAFEIDVVDTTGAGDAFAAGCTWGILDGCDDRGILRRGNAVGGLACRKLGARAALPDSDEALRLMNR